jgi:hypothetical protein
MLRKVAWVMSESDTFDLLNAIDQRLETARLDEHSRGVLIRLRSILEDDLDVFSSGRRHLQATSGDVRDLTDLRRTV